MAISTAQLDALLHNSPLLDDIEVALRSAPKSGYADQSKLADRLTRLQQDAGIEFTAQYDPQAGELTAAIHAGYTPLDAKRLHAVMQDVHSFFKGVNLKDEHNLDRGDKFASLMKEMEIPASAPAQNKPTALKK